MIQMLNFMPFCHLTGPSIYEILSLAGRKTDVLNLIIDCRAYYSYLKKKEVVHMDCSSSIRSVASLPAILR